MIALNDKIYDQSLDLPIDDRLNLIDKLLKSTNIPIQDDINSAWLKEVERRCQEIETGKAKLIPSQHL